MSANNPHKGSAGAANKQSQPQPKAEPRFCPRKHVISKLSDAAIEVIQCQLEGLDLTFGNRLPSHKAEAVKQALIKRFGSIIPK